MNPATSPAEDGDGSRTAASTDVDPAEIARFEKLAHDWWDPHGPFRPLHKLNPIRLTAIRDRSAAYFGRDPLAARPLAGLRVLDIGCGGGLMSEPMARLGALVTGIDAGERNIAIARAHARQSKLAIDYRAIGVEALAAEGQGFDLILNLEVIEHTANPAAFLAASAGLLAPGGMMAMATLNRTLKSFALAVVGAEYVLRWLPRGTHDWRRFIKPEELVVHLVRLGLAIRETVGMTYDPIHDRWSIGRDTGVNYLMFATKSG